MSFLDLEVMFLKTKEYNNQDFKKAVEENKASDAKELTRDIQEVKMFLNDMLENTLTAILESSASQAKVNYNAIDM